MKCVILTVGKEKDDALEEGILHFKQRLLRYVPVEIVYIDHQVTKEKEGLVIMEKLKKEDYVILLDERGSELTSEGVADMMGNRMVDGVRRVVFIVGGAYGVSTDVTVRANYIWRLSKLVFPHVLVRVILLEQLYRAMTILKGEKYHHS